MQLSNSECIGAIKSRILCTLILLLLREKKKPIELKKILF